MGLYVEMPNVGFQTSAVFERIAPVLCLICDEIVVFLHIEHSKQMIQMTNRSIVEINNNGEMV